MMIKVSGVLAAGAAIAVLGLTACTPVEKQASGTVASPSTAAKAPASSAPKAPKSAPADTPGVAKVGGVFTYPDGLAVSVVSVSRGAFRVGAAGHKAGNVSVRVVVKFTNGTSAPVELGGTHAEVRTGEAGIKASAVFDYSQNIQGFSGTVAPGRSASTTVGFSVAPADLGRVDIEVDPSGIDRDSALFEGRLK